MKKDDKILDVSKSVKWIGILDYDIVTFDVVMTTDHGTTYNSYFIDAQKKTIVETSKEKFWDVYLEKVKKVCDPAEIEYIILNHTEPDHSGNLKHLLALAPNATVVGTGSAIRYLQDMTGSGFRSKQVKHGDTLDLGDKTLKFIGAPNLHWPDSMYTYLEEENILFTCDSFGSHYADERMFDDQVGDFSEAFDYYFDVILKPFSKFMLKAIDKIRPLDIDVVCPGHGPILRSDWKKWVDLSEKKSREYLEQALSTKPRVLIAYVSAYGYTLNMAREIEKGIKAVGDIDTCFIDLETAPLGEIEENLIRCTAVMVGSPTLNQNTLFPVYKMMAVVNPIRDKGKPAAAFGSYGWSGEAPDIIESMLKSLKLKAFETKAIKFQANGEKTRELQDFGKAFGNFIIG